MKKSVAKTTDFTVVAPLRLLQPEEQKLLKECEKLIDKHKEAFWRVGQALTEIHEQKLYREQYDTFEDYVYNRWRFTRQQAYRLISASEVRESLKKVSPMGDIPDLPTTERAFRELVLIPTTEGQLKVLISANKNAKSPKRITSKDIRTAGIELGIIEKPAKTIERPKNGAGSHIGEMFKNLRDGIERGDKKKSLLKLLEEVEAAVLA